MDARSPESAMADAAMDCAEAEALLPLVADGAIDHDADPALFAHLGHCAACQESLARHDLVALALARDGVGSAPARVVRYRLPLPWAVASAACLALALGLAWSSARAARAEADYAARVAAVTQPAAASAPETEVIGIAGDDPAHPTYVIMQDGQAVLVEPKGPAQRHGQRRDLAHQVSLTRY
jgi:hypothetical protein